MARKTFPRRPVMGSLLEESKRVRDEYANLQGNSKRRRFEQKLQSNERQQLARQKRKVDNEEKFLETTSAKKATLNGLVNRGNESLDYLSKVSLGKREQFEKKKLNADVVTERAKRNRLVTEQWAQKVQKMLDAAKIKFDLKISNIKQAVDTKLLNASKLVDLAQKVEVLIEREYNTVWSQLERAREKRELDILRIKRNSEKLEEVLRRGNEPSRKRKRENVNDAFAREQDEIRNARRASIVDSTIASDLIRKDARVKMALRKNKKYIKDLLVKHRAQMIKRGKVTKPTINRIFKIQSLLGGRPQPMEAATYVASTASQRYPPEFTVNRG